MTDASVNGVTLAYEVTGEGDPIVLVCGLGQPAFTWQLGIAPALVAAGWRVVTFDSRGMPPSDSPPAPYTVADLAADTAGLIEHLDLAPCRVAGYSLGSWVVEELACTHPEIVRAAAFVAGFNRSTVWERVSCTYGRDLARLDELPRLQGTVELLRYLPNERLQDDAVVQAWVDLLAADASWPNPGRLGQWEAAVAWTHDEARTERWPRVTAPALVLAFEHDIDSPPRHARAAAAELLDGRYVEIAGCSHLGPFEEPDTTARELVDFFAST